MSPLAGAEQAVITRDGLAVGYLRWQRVGRDALAALGLDEIPTNAVDADLLIGLTTALNNVCAHRAFERAGFCKLRQDLPPSPGPCYLMVYDLYAS